ncbi:MAG: SirB2 family protein [Neisseria sp.]|nr:SirB2 family protein [Neisseria sp.]
MDYLIVKHSHMFLVAMTIILFNIRFWAFVSEGERRVPAFLQVLPHINDTLLLFLGLYLMHLTKWSPFAFNWLGVKLLLLVAYVLLGKKAMKSTPKTANAYLFYVLAMTCIGTMVFLARMKPF